jgi:hypothetical protein
MSEQSRRSFANTPFAVVSQCIALLLGALSVFRSAVRSCAFLAILEDRCES